MNMKKGLTIKNEYYIHHLKDRCSDVPEHILKEIIKEFSALAKFYMDSDVDSETLIKTNESVIDWLNTKFNWLPLHLLGEAYIRGSLGELGGTTRLIPRTVYTWLNAVSEKAQNLYAQDKSRIDAERREAEEKAFKLNQKYYGEFGTAAHTKLVWYCAGKINPKDWDRYTLDKIVEQFRQGYDIYSLHPSRIYEN